MFANSIFSSFLTPDGVLNDHLRHLTKYEGYGTKISILKLFSEFGENLEVQSIL